MEDSTRITQNGYKMGIVFSDHVTDKAEDATGAVVSFQIDVILQANGNPMEWPHRLSSGLQLSVQPASLVQSLIRDQLNHTVDSLLSDRGGLEVGCCDVNSRELPSSNLVSQLIGGELDDRQLLRGKLQTQ